MRANGPLRIYPLTASLGLLLISGCGGMNEGLRVKAVSDRATFDLSCKSINVVRISETSYGVIGCDKKATYVLVSCMDDQREATCTVTLDAAQRADGVPEPAAGAGNTKK